MPDIVVPRIALAPGTSASASVSCLVTASATAGAGWPIQSATMPICGSARSGITSRASPRRARSPAIASSTVAISTMRLWRADQATSAAIIASASRRHRPASAPGMLSAANALPPSRRSASRKNVARDTTRSLARRPDSTTAKPWREKVSPISIGRFSN